MLLFERAHACVDTEVIDRQNCKGKLRGPPGREIEPAIEF
jgi:hypothetical protein